MDHAIISKGVPHPLPGFGTFFLIDKKKVPQRKVAGDIPSPLKLFFFHSTLFEVLNAL